MRVLSFIVLLLLSAPVIGQRGEVVDLEWKLAPNERLTYLTVMEDIDTASMEMDFGPLFRAFEDSTKSGVSSLKSMFNKLNESLKDINLETTLSQGKGDVIEVTMSAISKKAEAASDDEHDSIPDLMRMIQAVSGGVMLRGSVYSHGSIHSFWVKNDQKNLLASFFQLPAKPVKAGDTWSLDINYIANDQNFVCDSSYRHNEVKLVEVRKEGKETVAVLKYDIVEYVKGRFSSPLMFRKDPEGTEVMMKFAHQGIAEFSIDRGRWISYDGLMNMVTTGLMQSNKKTKFTLIPQ